MKTMRIPRGQAITELIIIIPILLILLFGIFEFTYAYRAKTTMNVATFEAARAGALNHARLAPMRDALGRGMMPLYVKGDSSLYGLGKAKFWMEAEQKAIDVAASKIGGIEMVEVISPTKSMFDAFKSNRLMRLNGGKKDVYVDVIPNDNLNFRATDLKKVKVTLDGKTVDVDQNVQDANLLKIKALWCYQLKVPGLKDLIVKTVEGSFGVISASPEQKVCSAIDKAFNLGGGNRRSIAIVSHAVVRMQSPIVYDSTEKNLK
ncbi:TadE/TadG family type IV pilus assembly protein [Pleionea litopenaei]|uniref:TadE/TadG family type IV pilus assembly protein n=1 Tax=Pleionea litopenaei TaxID=3070815 RepID=A0AA51RTC1_9GAMM|nr:TadE/TadG family type IV pilus assembly protein [Pleionea sp. HL-JVS1]WMS87256.1 TadE/TadG family type IV pilus assembly protein [Pleionea sp. HL-JVS1]